MQASFVYFCKVIIHELLNVIFFSLHNNYVHINFCIVILKCWLWYFFTTSWCRYFVCFVDDHFDRTSIEKERLNCLYVMTMDNLNSAKTAMLSHHSTKSQKCVHLEMYDITCTLSSLVCFFAFFAWDIVFRTVTWIYVLFKSSK